MSCPFFFFLKKIGSYYHQIHDQFKCLDPVHSLFPLRGNDCCPLLEKRPQIVFANECGEQHQFVSNKLNGKEASLHKGGIRSLLVKGFFALQTEGCVLQEFARVLVGVQSIFETIIKKIE